MNGIELLRNTAASIRLPLACLLVGMMFLQAGITSAADGYVHFKGRSNPLYIANLQFQYSLLPGPVAEVVVVIPEQTKYSKHPLDQVRRIEFLEVVGEKKMSPVFRVRLHLRTPGHWREVYLMPLRELQGSSFGAPWTYPVDFDRGYEENADELQEIRLVPPRPGR